MTSLPQTLNLATPALDPEYPLPNGDERWQDFSPARGGNALIRVRNALTRHRNHSGNRFLKMAFTSHRGAGKTTELKRLEDQLSEHFHCIYLAANVEMHAMVIEVEDLLLVIAKTVESSMREAGMPIGDDHLHKVFQWFADTVKVTSAGQTYLADLKARVEAKATIPFIAKLIANLTALLRVESKHRTEVKETLKKFPHGLIKAVNILLDAANDRLKDHGKQLLITIDNMDRYNPDVIDALINRNADRLHELHCNLLLTPPISMEYRPESVKLDQNYTCVIMPTIKLREQDQGYTHLMDPGKSLLLKALGRRIDLDKLIPEQEARERLVYGSGGSIRNLLKLAYDASLEATGDHISLQDVNGVLQRYQLRLRDIMDINGLQTVLRFIQENKRLNDNPDCLKALHYELAFMYNGKVWYDIHPLLAELDTFRSELTVS
ncbi:MAG: hypothetical protein QNK37_22055 [Acidobacteriota bacterium]|nr:hypothetical protein [Acidobacteriota bacterium]